MDCLIIYDSKTGFSKHYAEMLAEMLDTAAVSAKNVKDADIRSADAVLWCAGVYASRVRGIGKLRTMAAKYDNKRFFVLAVGGTKDENGFYREELEKANLPGGSVRLFYARGGFDEEKMSFFDRFIIKMLRKSLSEKTDLSEEERNMLDSIGENDFVPDENVIENVKKALIG